MAKEIFSTDAFLLSLLGNIPMAGDIIKDQVADYLARVEKDRIYEVISTLRSITNSKISRKIDQSELPEILNSVLLCIEKSKVEGGERKRNIMASIVGNAIVLGHEQSRVQWFVRVIYSVSIQAIDVLGKLAEDNTTQGFQFHSHSGVLSRIEESFGYSFMVALLKELSQAGLIDLKIDHSSMVAENPRLIVFWRDVSNDFISYLKA